jgi:biopolymer transport protein ExbD
MSEINMTPLIDVMLVLLVIFIITAPLISSSLPLDLPKAEGTPAVAAPSVLALAIDRDGKVFLDEQPSGAAQIIARAVQAVQRDPATEVQLRADSRVAYGRVAEVIAWVQSAGLTRIGLVTEAARR